MKQISRMAMMMRRRNFGSSYFSVGNNNYGQLALNANQHPNVLTAPTAPYLGVTQPDSWTAVSMRANAVAAVKNNGTLWVAGDNGFGQLGLGDTNSRNRFTQVLCETTVGSGVYKSDWVDVGMGSEHMAALDAAGNIWTAGRNDIAAAVGNGATTPNNVTRLYNTALTPAPFRQHPIVFKALQVGHRFTMGLDTNNDIWTFGNNGSRQLGRASPGAVANPTQDTYHRKVDPPGPWQKMFAGGYHAGALHADGTLWLWGLGDRGQKGVSDVNLRDPIIVPTIGGIPWVDVYMGENNTYIRNANGEIYGMGSNTNGAVGVGLTDNNVMSPTKLTGLWRVVAIDWYHSFGIKVDGTLWSWGDGGSGKLGLGNTNSYNTPQQIGTDTNWSKVVVGQYASMAFKRVEMF